MTHKENMEERKFRATFVMSVLLAIAGVVLILWSDDDATKKAVFGLLGMVAGYWLR